MFKNKRIYVLFENVHLSELSLKCQFIMRKWLYLLINQRYIESIWLKGTSWPWSYGTWIYYYLCNQCLSPLMLWVRITRCTTLCDKVCQWLATGLWFSLGTVVSSTNKTDCHDITEILLKVALNTIKQSNRHMIGQSKMNKRLPKIT